VKTGIPAYLAGLLAASVLVAAVLVFPARADISKRKSPVVLAVEQAAPAVVNINTEQMIRQSRGRSFGFNDPFFDEFFRDFFERSPRRYTATSLGSGVVIDKRGYILTNEHVINRATSISVSLLSGKNYKAEVVGSDATLDLAILRIDAGEDLPTVRIGRSDDLMIGETVIAIGNPFGLSHTVSTGVISALHRSIKASEDRIYPDFIQIDASINPGNSGGPLLNIEGELIGVNTAIHGQGQGIGFSIPINKALRVVDDLIRYSEVRVGYSGLGVQELDPRTARALRFDGTAGVAVSRIWESGPAEKAGIRPGDVITKVEQENIFDVLEFDTVMRQYAPGDSVGMTYFRAGKEGSVRFTLAKFPRKTLSEMAWHRLGVRVSKAEGNAGVVVNRIRTRSSAQLIGMKTGDIVLRINNSKTDSIEDFYKAVSRLQYKSSALLLVQRGMYATAVTVGLE